MLGGEKNEITLILEPCSKINRLFCSTVPVGFFQLQKKNQTKKLIKRDLLDKVLEGVAIGPLLCERGTVSNCGEMS